MKHAVAVVLGGFAHGLGIQQLFPVRFADRQQRSDQLDRVRAAALFHQAYGIAQRLFARFVGADARVPPAELLEPIDRALVLCTVTTLRDTHAVRQRLQRLLVAAERRQRIRAPVEQRELLLVEQALVTPVELECAVVCVRRQVVTLRLVVSIRHARDRAHHARRRQVSLALDHDDDLLVSLRGPHGVVRKRLHGSEIQERDLQVLGRRRRILADERDDAATLLDGGLVVLRIEQAAELSLGIDP